MPGNIDQETFANQYRPTVTEDDFQSRYKPQEDSGVNQLNIDAYTNMAPPDVDKAVSMIHQAYIHKGPFTGSVSDQLFNQGPVGRIMSAFGNNFKDGWNGTGPSEYQIELEKEAKEHDANILTAIRNAVAKPTAAALDFVTKAPMGVMSGIAGATEQTAEELSKTGQVFYNDPNSAVLGKVLGYPLLAGGEILSGYAHGAGMEGGVSELPSEVNEASRGVDHVQQILEARSKGQVGEGEAGFFQLKPPTPEDIEARAAAAHDAGLPPLPPETTSVVPTVDELAAKMDPDTFSELNRLTDVQENLRSSRDSLMAQIKDSTDPQYIYKDQQRIKSQLEDIPGRLQSLDEQLRDLIPDVNSARERSEELLNSDSPEGNAYRNLVQAQAFEKALALQPVKAKAEETLRLANDLKETSQPDTKADGQTQVQTQTKPPAGSDKTTIKPEKKPEVKVSPEAVSGVSQLKKVQGTGEKTPLSLNQRLEIDSVIKGWKSEVGEVPQEEVLKTEQQLTEAQRLADDNLPTATRVAMGDAEVPEGYNVHPEAVLRILKKRAEDTGDVALGLKLADTRLAGEARTMGQRLNLLRGIYDIDPVGIIQDLNNSWKDAASKKITDTIKDIKKEVDDAMATFAPDLKAFAESIKCDY